MSDKSLSPFLPTHPHYMSVGIQGWQTASPATYHPCTQSQRSHKWALLFILSTVQSTWRPGMTFWNRICSSSTPGFWSQGDLWASPHPLYVRNDGGPNHPLLLIPLPAAEAKDDPLTFPHPSRWKTPGMTFWSTIYSSSAPSWRSQGWPRRLLSHPSSRIHAGITSCVFLISSSCTVEGSRDNILSQHLRLSPS